MRVRGHHPRTIDEVWGPAFGPQIRIACTEWNIADDGRLTWDAAEVSNYYVSYLAMLRAHQVWLANQFLLASNGDNLDMITAHGQPTPAYSAFKSRGTRSCPSHEARYGGRVHRVHVGPTPTPRIRMGIRR